MMVDILVIGGGVAGATAAITAADDGATVTLIEKQSHLGGTCIYSAGNLLQLGGPDALEHLRTLSFYTTPDDVLASYLEGLTSLRSWLTGLGATTADADPRFLPNCWPNSPGADGVVYYSVTGDGGGGPALWGVLERALLGRSIQILTETALISLVEEDGRVIGADVRGPSGTIERIFATKGVVLATGGIENDPSLTSAYLPVPLLHPVGNPGNTGDGMRAAQEVGAALWHMSAFYGFWAFSAPASAGDWSTSFPLLFFAPSHLIVDSNGDRFHAEFGREPHDAMRSIGDFLPHRKNRPSLPAWVIFDEGLLGAGPLCRFPSATGYSWSDDNSEELAAGWIVEAHSPAELAAKTGLDSSRLAETITAFNGYAEIGIDADFARPAETMKPVNTDRLFAVQLWPGVATASGGPKRDAQSRVVRPDGSPIAGLYAAGGAGGVWGHLTEHGGGLTDGLVFGAIAVRDAIGSVKPSDLQLRQDEDARARRDSQRQERTQQRSTRNDP